MSNHDLNAAAFLECVGALLDTSEVSSMKRWRHHFSITCYQHSLFVSYVAFRLARYFGWDYRAAARAGLLHDLYLYDPADGSAHPGNQCLDHPEFALRNTCPGAGRPWWSTSPTRCAPRWRSSISTRPGACSAGSPCPRPEARAGFLRHNHGFPPFFSLVFVRIRQFSQTLKNLFKKSWFLI